MMVRNRPKTLTCGRHYGGERRKNEEKRVGLRVCAMSCNGVALRKQCRRGVASEYRAGSGGISARAKINNGDISSLWRRVVAAASCFVEIRPALSTSWILISSTSYAAISITKL